VLYLIDIVLSFLGELIPKKIVDQLT